MTPSEFVAKWRTNVPNERAATQEHFLDLPTLLGEIMPKSTKLKRMGNLAIILGRVS